MISSVDQSLRERHAGSTVLRTCTHRYTGTVSRYSLAESTTSSTVLGLHDVGSLGHELAHTPVVSRLDTLAPAAARAGSAVDTYVAAARWKTAYDHDFFLNS